MIVQYTRVLKSTRFLTCAWAAATGLFSKLGFLSFGSFVPWVSFRNCAAPKQAPYSESSRGTWWEEGGAEKHPRPSVSDGSHRPKSQHPALMVPRQTMHIIIRCLVLACGVYAFVPLCMALWVAAVFFSSKGGRSFVHGKRRRERRRGLFLVLCRVHAIAAGPRSPTQPAAQHNA